MGKPKGHTPAQVEAAVRARQGAQRTPSIVRKAMLHTTPRTIGEVTLQPFSLLHLWLLEDVKSPFLGDGATIQSASIKDIALAVYIFSAPITASELLEEGGIADLLPPARELMAKVPPSDLQALGTAIGEMIAEGLAPAPGGDDANPSRPRKTTGA